MRPVSPDRRPPAVAWAMAALALMPLLAAWAAHRQGWAGPWREAGDLWAMLVLGLSAGMVAGPALVAGRAGAATACVTAALAMLGLMLTGLATLPEAVLLGLTLIWLLDLWAAREGLVPAWWPRLKLGLTVLAAALLLGRVVG